MNGTTINSQWSLSPIGELPNNTVSGECKICKSTELIRYVRMPKKGNCFGLYICNECLTRLAILQNIETVKEGGKLDYEYAKKEAYNYKAV